MPLLILVPITDQSDELFISLLNKLSWLDLIKKDNIKNKKSMKMMSISSKPDETLIWNFIHQKIILIKLLLKFYILIKNI